MAEPNPKSGGALLAAAILLGVLGGAVMGQPSVGFLAGLGVGLIALGTVWLWERRR